VITISAHDARNDFRDGTAFAFETQDWRRNGCAMPPLTMPNNRDAV